MAKKEPHATPTTCPYGCGRVLRRNSDGREFGHKKGCPNG